MQPIRRGLPCCLTVWTLLEIITSMLCAPGRHREGFYKQYIFGSVLVSFLYMDVSFSSQIYMDKIRTQLQSQICSSGYGPTAHQVAQMPILGFCFCFCFLGGDSFHYYSLHILSDDKSCGLHVHNIVLLWPFPFTVLVPLCLDNYNSLLFFLSKNFKFIWDRERMSDGSAEGERIFKKTLLWVQSHLWAQSHHAWDHNLSRG